METDRPGDPGDAYAPSAIAMPAWLAFGATDTGEQDLRAAIGLVGSGAAASVVLSGFSGASGLLDEGAGIVDGVIVEPRVRAGGGAFDIVVRRPVAPGA